MAKKTLTLDIGSSTVALAEYEVSGRGLPKLLNYGTATLGAPLDAENAETVLGTAVMEIVRERGIRPGPVSVSLSGQMVFPRVASIAAAGGDDKFEQAVRFEIEQNVPFPIDEMVCDRQILGENENGEQSVLIVAAKLDQVEPISSALTAAGFRPESVGVAPISLVNAVRAADPSDDCVLVLDIGAKTTSLVIVEGEKLYNRSIPIAGNNVTREIAQALGCTVEEAEEVKLSGAYVSLGGVAEDEDEVADRVSKACRAVMTRLQAEISRSVNFYRSQQGGGAPVKLYLTGGTALLGQTAEFFADGLGVEVEYFSPFSFFGVGPAVDAERLGADAALIAATAGLALRAAGRERFAVNLLPPSILEARAEKAKVPVIAAAAVMLIGALVLVWIGANGRGASVTDALERARVNVEKLQGFEKKVKAGETEVAEAQAAADATRALIESRSAAVLRVNAVRDALMPGMWIEKWEENGKITIRGWSDIVDPAVAAFAKKKDKKGGTASEIVAERLKASSVVDDHKVKIADMSSFGKTGSGKPAVVQFTVEVKFK